MVIQYLTCPMCGFEFDRSDTLCEHGCPLGSMCRMMRCPSCDFEFPETPRTVSWLQRVFRRNRPQPAPLPEHVCSVKDLRRGDRATVLCIGQMKDRESSLAVFGLAPDCEISLVQQVPACVIRVGETEIAIDDDIAREILVEKIDAHTAWPAAS